MGGTSGDYQMLIGIYDYAAKLLNNMTATGDVTGGGEGQGAGVTTIINNQSLGSEQQQEEEEQEEQEPRKQQGNSRNLTTKLLQATTRALAQHVPALPISLSLSPLPALLLQALDAADVAQGQRIDHTTRGPTTTTPEALLPPLLEQPPTTTSSLLGNATTTGSPESSSTQDVVYSAFGAAMPAGNLSGFIQSSTTAASSVLSSAVTTLPTLPTLPATSSMAATFQAQTVATFIAATGGGKNRPTTIVVYPTGECL